MPRRKNKPHHDSVGVIIAAGGKGRRFGGKQPKQFLSLGRRSVLEFAIRAFVRIPHVKEIVVVAPAGLLKQADKILKSIRFAGAKTVVAGGKERQDSVWNGLRAFARPPDTVLVHDAARPLIQQRVIRSILRELKTHRAAIVGVKVKDTIKVSDRNGFARTTLDRTRLWAVQTPQGFTFSLLMRAHEKARRDSFVGTDEASLVERLNVPVKIVEGDYGNIKITTKEDLKSLGSAFG